MANTWIINFEPKEGGRLTGQLTIDDENLTYVAMYDSSNATIIKSILGAVGSFVATGGHAAYIRGTSENLTITLPKAEIKSTETKNSLLAHRLVVTMKDDQEFVFNYGMLSVAKLAAAIG